MAEKKDAGEASLKDLRSNKDVDHRNAEAVVAISNRFFFFKQKTAYEV